MRHTFFLAASGDGVGLTSVSLGVVRALDRRGIRVGFCKPISQNHTGIGDNDPSVRFMQSTMGHTPPESIPIQEADNYVREEQTGDLMERIVEKVSAAGEGSDVVIVEGLLPAAGRTFNNRLNRLIASSLDAEVILVTTLGDETPEQFSHKVETLAALYGGIDNPKLIGCIINKIGKPRGESMSGVVPIVDSSADESGSDITSEEKTAAAVKTLLDGCEIFKSGSFELLGAIPANSRLQSFRTSDVARHLEAESISAGDMHHRRVHSVALCARAVSHIYHVFAPGALLITPADREDVIIAAALAALNGVVLSGIILTGDAPLAPELHELCRRSFETGLPVLKVRTGSYQTVLNLSQMSSEVPPDDIERMNHVMDFIARAISGQKLEDRCKVELAIRMSPAAFRHTLASRAREANKRIVLPEGDEPRTIQAAAACCQRGIARCVLLGNPDEIRRVAAANGVTLPDEIEILDAAALRPRYVPHLVEMRKSKNLSEHDAMEALEDNVMLGTIMLAMGEVDGLVSGAVHSSANTIRPALQLIKTHAKARVVSSVFFMCLPEQVLVYGDCAVNPNPDAEALADIAIQSAETAEQFGIPARVALISYSTGESGSGEDVEKVRKATAIAKSLRPDLLLDGPLQYDAAAIAEVAATKAPDSPVAGKATIFIFPDLNTGNTTYKAVQRSANLISIGPVLQGLRKPVNDLSRGALVDDIIYTIAVTAIQAAGGERS
ncbi:MAG: phosphate acetyltransferase [Luteolibacter sp.]|uniref:phosphate acetyltransferase n=1 Tax=Luteolibacter sp. TaxID=1962973 RepID=UPI003267FA7B